MIRTRLVPWVIVFMIASTFPLPVLAADPPDSQLQKIVDELRAIAAKARKERSADPWLLKALDDLAQRYYWPWRTQVVDESFKDGDYTKNPAWEVAAGSFWVDASLGLRSKAAPPPARTESSGGKKKKFEDVLKEAVISEIERDKGTQPPVAESAVVTEIYLPLKAANAFALDLSFSQHQPSTQAARMEFGLFEAGRASRAYVLAFVSGSESALELLRVQGTAAAIIERAPLDKAPVTGEVQRLNWRRDPEGGMVVLLNDKPLIQIGDRGMNAPFKTLGLINRGGDYAVRKVTLFDAQ